MRDYALQARVALNVYLSRGQSALRCMHSKQWPRLERVLRRRAAAFHNFRAADALAQEAGLDVAADSEVAALLAAIFLVDTELAAKMQLAQEDIRSELVKTQAAKAKIGHYRSKFNERNNFIQAV